MFDLDAYLARAGDRGPRAPTLAPLRDLTATRTPRRSLSTTWT
jgi:hypothetical protein